MNKDELHRALDDLIPATTVSRSNLRIIGHALIELGLMTSMECGWSGCRQDTRDFAPYSETGTGRGGKGRHPRTPSVDHVVSRSDGGSDLPENIQLLHFACNAAKGALDANKNPAIKAKMSEASKVRWNDPKYRALMTGRTRTPTSSARASKSMVDRWKTVSPEERSERAKRAWDTRRKNQKDAQ